jgi:hypothetical protein
MELKVCFVSLQTQGTTTYEEKHRYLFIIYLFINSYALNLIRNIEDVSSKSM